MSRTRIDFNRPIALEQAVGCLAESIIVCGRFEPDDFARRIAAIHIQVIGKATRAFVEAYHRNGGNWKEAAQFRQRGSHARRPRRPHSR